MVISQHCYANLYMQVGCACKVIRVHRKMETSLSDFNNKRYLQQLRKINARDPSGSKQSEAGAYAPNEYGSAVLYGFPPQYSKKNYGCGSYPHSQLWNSWSGFARRRWIGNLFTQTFITKGGGCYGIWFFRKPLPCNLYIHHADHLRPQRQH